MSPEPAAAVSGPSGIGGGRIFRFDSLSSTNTWAMQHLDELRHGDVITAGKQTAGRGRRDRSWISGEGGLAFSLIFGLSRTSDRGGLAGMAAALGVADALSSMGLEPRLKWPNDVMLSDRKVCGILCESRSSADTAVIGVGMNVNQTRDELDRLYLDNPVTSLYAETGDRRDPLSVLKLLLPFIGEEVSAFMTHDPALLPDRWEPYDWLRGCRVSLMDGSGAFSGVYRGLDEQGRVIIQTADGDEQRFWTGDVSRIRIRGKEDHPAARAG
ncbi:biotin--[acetyl-CoA-carboxylase] ligase [bacterium]|nr:biotin--[acetyl-CoA-carboxylase] ligase [bacterium]